MEQIQQPRCTVCQSQNLLPSLSFGKVPPSNRFLPPEAGNVAPEDFYSMSLGYCQQCGTIQLVDRMPIEVIRPRYDWLVYNEPERHLDEVASKLSGLPGINASSRFLGITYKDKSTLDRMERLGFPNTACINESDLKCSVEPFGLETIQDALSRDSTVMRLREIYGSADVILVRHIVVLAPQRLGEQQRDHLFVASAVGTQSAAQDRKIVILGRATQDNVPGRQDIQVTDPVSRQLQFTRGQRPLVDLGDSVLIQQPATRLLCVEGRRQMDGDRRT